MYFQQRTQMKISKVKIRNINTSKILINKDF